MENFVADAIFIDAPSERVFSALVEPEDILVWMDAESADVLQARGGAFTARRADGSRVTGSIAALEPGRRLELDDYYWELGNDRRGPMSVRFLLEEKDGGVWLTVRQDGLDVLAGWEAFARATRAEWVQATVALKRHIEDI
jgi:uncharacterized protein YndB with AHSA1/START domain